MREGRGGRSLDREGTVKGLEYFTNGLVSLDFIPKVWEPTAEC